MHLSLFTYLPVSVDCIIETNQDTGQLYLGNIGALLHQTKELNCQAVVSVVKLQKYEGINILPNMHLKIPIEDFENEDIAQYFDIAADFIHEKLQTTNVLVHCMAGISRSTTIVLAYLMKHHNMKYSDAYLFVSNKRKIIYPNQGFRQQLQKYQTLLNQKEQQQEQQQQQQYQQKK